MGLGIAPDPAGVGEQGAVVDAHAGFVSLELAFGQEAHVVGRDRGDPARLRQVQDRLGVSLFAGAAGSLHFEVEAIAAQCLPAVEAARRLIVLAAGERLPDVAVLAAGEHDEPLDGRGLEPRALDHRSASLLPIEEGSRHQPGQIPVTREVLA